MIPFSNPHFFFFTYTSIRILLVKCKQNIYRVSLSIKLSLFFSLSLFNVKSSRYKSFLSLTFNDRKEKKKIFPIIIDLLLTKHRYYTLFERVVKKKTLFHSISRSKKKKFIRTSLLTNTFFFFFFLLSQTLIITLVSPQSKGMLLYNR